VADFDACAHGVKTVEAELGPVEVIVNNAGIPRDATMRKMTRQAWDEVLHTNSGRLLQHVQGGLGRYA